MNTRSLAARASAAFVVATPLGVLWHDILMGSYYSAASGGTMRDPPVFWSIILGYAFVAVVMAYMYPKGYEGGAAVTEGFKFGAIIGALWWVPTQLVLYGATDGTAFSIVFVDGGWHLLEEGLAGVAMAMVHARQAGIDG